MRNGVGLAGPGGGKRRFEKTIGLRETIINRKKSTWKAMKRGKNGRSFLSN